MKRLTQLINKCASRVRGPQFPDLFFKGVNGSCVTLLDSRSAPAQTLSLTAREIMKRATDALADHSTPFPSAYLTALRALDDQRKMGKGKPADEKRPHGDPDPTAKWNVGYTIKRP